jgi:hypothetical protein
MKDNIFIAVNVVSTFTGSCETHPGGVKSGSQHSASYRNEFFVLGSSNNDFLVVVGVTEGAGTKPDAMANTLYVVSPTVQLVKGELNSAVEG